MLRVFLIGLLVPGWLLLPAPARAHHFTIDLEVRAGKEVKKAQADVAALGVKPRERGTFQVKAGSRVTVKWTMTSADPKTTYKNVLVHFFVVAEEKAGQLSVPKLDKGVVAESALTMDFTPGDSTRGELSFALPQAGVYLLRLETIGAAVDVDGHEHFAALDLVVE